MLHLARKVRGAVIHATDGDIGKLEDFYFQTLPWVIRYLVVDTGTWLSGRRVVLSPMSVNGPWDLTGIPVSLTREQVRHSPALEDTSGLSHDAETQILGYYGYPHYWGWSGVWGDYDNPGALVTAPAHPPTERPTSAGPEVRSLASINRSTGYHIHAIDGEIGHVDDFLIGQESWRIRALVVDTSNWLGGRSVIVSTSALTGVDPGRGELRVDVTRDTVKASPSFDTIAPALDARETAPPFTIL